jgi:hypothetical protein
MKRLSLIALALTAPLAVMAQTTVFNDNFASDISDPSSSYLNGFSGGSMAWASGTGMTLSAPTTGHLSDIIGSFSSVTLANTGDYVSLVVNFNSPNLGQGGTSLAGLIMMGLDNSQGVSPTSAGLTESINSSATGGPTSGYLGYAGDIQMQASAKTSTKFFAKTGSGLNNLTYNSNVSTKSANFTTTGTGNGALANSDLYTLTYTITALNTGASQLGITAQIYDNTASTMIDNVSIASASSVPTSTLDTFDIGLYSGSEPTGYTLSLTDVSVLTNVPEPASIVLFLGGVGALAFVRRFRR